MASSNKESSARPMISLSTLSILESSSQWVKWSRDIKDYLTMTGFGDLLSRNALLPEQGTLSAETWEAKKESWTAKQERAFAVIRNRLGYNARESVKLLTTVATILNKIELRFRPTGSAVFVSLDREYHELTLADCTGVMDYAERLRKAKNELLELDSSCKIGEPHFVHKFLSGLGNGYEIFLATFNQTHSLIKTTAADGVAAVKAVTFDEAVMAAEKEEQRMKHQEEPKSAYIGTGTKANPDQVTLNVPYCTHCHKNYHTATDCWALHPELKKQSNNKKRRFNGGNNQSKRSKPTDDNEDQYNFGGASVHLMASSGQTDLLNLWALDTGCTQHLSHRKQDFITMKPYTGGAIQGIRGTTIQPKEVGTVKLGCNIRRRQVIMLLAGTFFCPDAGINLISVSQLMPKRGVNVSFHPTFAKI